jgi:hypothetical protein
MAPRVVVQLTAIAALMDVPPLALSPRQFVAAPVISIAIEPLVV